MEAEVLRQRLRDLMGKEQIKIEDEKRSIMLEQVNSYKQKGGKPIFRKKRKVTKNGHSQWPKSQTAKVASSVLQRDISSQKYRLLTSPITEPRQQSPKELLSKRMSQVLKSMDRVTPEKSQTKLHAHPFIIKLKQSHKKNKQKKQAPQLRQSPHCIKYGGSYELFQKQLQDRSIARRVSHAKGKIDFARLDRDYGQHCIHVQLREQYKHSRSATRKKHMSLV